MEQGTRTRTTAATHMNANSSRSHMLIILQLKQVQEPYVCILETLAVCVLKKAPNIIHSQIFSKENITKQSTVNLVDLAGSERQRLSGSEADRLKEGTAINLSLTTLGNVIRFLGSSGLSAPLHRRLTRLCAPPAPWLTWQRGRRASTCPTGTPSSPSCSSLRWEATVAPSW